MATTARYFVACTFVILRHRLFTQITRYYPFLILLHATIAFPSQFLLSKQYTFSSRLHCFATYLCCHSTSFFQFNIFFFFFFLHFSFFFLLITCEKSRILAEATKQRMAKCQTSRINTRKTHGRRTKGERKILDFREIVKSAKYPATSADVRK